MKELKTSVEDVLASYEARVEGMGTFFDAAYSILSGPQGSFGGLKEEREKLRAQVQESLARNEHLRKKDFNNMMQGIQSAQEQREKEVGELLKGYINKEKAMALALRENLDNFKKALARGEAERVKEFQALIKAILAEQEKRKHSVISMLREFQEQQRRAAGKLRELLARGNSLRIKDLKLMVKEYGKQREKRLVLRKSGRGAAADPPGRDKAELRSPQPLAAAGSK